MFKLNWEDFSKTASSQSCALPLIGLQRRVDIWGRGRVKRKILIA